MGRGPLSTEFRFAHACLQVRWRTSARTVIQLITRLYAKLAQLPLTPLTEKIGLICRPNALLSGSRMPLSRHVGRLGFDALHVYDLDGRKAAKLKGDIEQANPALRVMDHLDTDELDVVLLSLSGPATIAFLTDERDYALFKGRPVFVSLGRPSYDHFTAHDGLDVSVAPAGTGTMVLRLGGARCAADAFHARLS